MSQMSACWITVFIDGNKRSLNQHIYSLQRQGLNLFCAFTVYFEDISRYNTLKFFMSNFIHFSLNMNDNLTISCYFFFTFNASELCLKFLWYLFYYTKCKGMRQEIVDFMTTPHPPFRDSNFGVKGINIYGSRSNKLKARGQGPTIGRVVE